MHYNSMCEHHLKELSGFDKPSTKARLGQADLIDNGALFRFPFFIRTKSHYIERPLSPWRTQCSVTYSAKEFSADHEEVTLIPPSWDYTVLLFSLGTAAHTFMHTEKTSASVKYLSFSRADLARKPLWESGLRLWIGLIRVLDQGEIRVNKEVKKAADIFWRKNTLCESSLEHQTHSKVIFSTCIRRTAYGTIP